MKSLKYVFTISIILAFTFACERFVRPENDTQISKFDDDESHYFGQNCMDCHYSAGRGEGWFTAAGSAQGNTQRATIEIYNDPNELPLKIIEYDGLGNAFTTEPIDYSSGVFVGIRSTQGNLRMMSGKVHTGQCNLCHGATALTLNVNW